MESEPAIWIPTALNLWRIPSLGVAIDEHGHQNDMAAPSLHRWVSWLWIAVRWYPEQFSAVTDIMFNEYTSISREGIQDLPLFFSAAEFRKQVWCSGGSHPHWCTRVWGHDRSVFCGHRKSSALCYMRGNFPRLEANTDGRRKTQAGGFHVFRLARIFGRF